jgi:hypothetical protein
VSGSPAVLTLPDDASARDLRTYVSRARKADPDGAMRLVGHGDVLAAYVSPVHGSGAPTVLGLRTLRLAAPSDLDVTVALGAMGDRLAGEPPGLDLPVPPAEVGASWAGVSPPRRGWEAVGGIGAGTLREVARAGITEIASGAGEGSGGHAVARLRGLVWSRTFSEFSLPAGAAFAVEALAFAVEGETVAVFASGPWTRLTTGRGHVLSRVPLGAGLA